MYFLSSGVVKLLLIQRFVRVNQQALIFFPVAFRQDSMATNMKVVDLSMEFLLNTNELSAKLEQDFLIK